MSSSRGIEGLAKTEKSKLLADLKARAQNRREREGGDEPVAVEPVSAGPKAFDFAQMPQHKQLRMMAAAAELSGIDNPFFHVHEGRAGSTTLCGNRTLLNFASYNYLGLNGHPEVSAAAKAAIDRYGTTVSASRLVAGERPIHRELESALARLHGTEAALVFVSGHATNVSTIGHLLGPKDLILCDALSHNSIVEGARMSGATRLMFPHNDLDALEDLLTRNRSRHERCLIAVEGLYSMDGDVPDLPRFIQVKQEHQAMLMVDEAHSIGVLGRTGAGIGEHFGVSRRDVEIWMGTFSKSFASCGGYVAGEKRLMDYLRYTTPGFVYSVGMSPANAAAALAALRVMRREPQRVEQLQSNAAFFLDQARAAGLNTGASQHSAIVPVILGRAEPCVQLFRALFAQGVYALPIMYPTVPENASRLRFFVSSLHTKDEMQATVRLIAAAVKA